MFPPERRSEAGQSAAEDYMQHAPRTEQSLIPPLPLCQRKLHPTYKARLGSVRRGRGELHEAAELPQSSTAPAHLTEQALADHNEELDTYSGWMPCCGSQADIADSYTPPDVHDMPFEADALIGSSAAIFDKRHTQYEGHIGNSRLDRCGDNNIERDPPVHRGLTSAATPVVDATLHNVVPRVEHSVSANAVAHSVKTSDNDTYRRCERNMDPNCPFTSQARTAESVTHVASVDAARIEFPQPCANEISPILQLAVPSTPDFIGQVIGPLAGDREHADNSVISTTPQPLHGSTSVTSSIDSLCEMSSAHEQPSSVPTKQTGNSNQRQTTTEDRNTTAVLQDAVPRIESTTSPRRWNVLSEVENRHGILRTTSYRHLGANLIEEQTGDIVELNKSDYGPRKHDGKTKTKNSIRLLNAPEAKNGGTGADDPRARKPVSRVIKNWWTGSTRAPRDEPPNIFQVGDRTPGKGNLEEMIKTRRHQGGADIRYTMQKIIRRFWGPDVIKRFGFDWVDDADADESHMQEIEEFVLGLAIDKSTLENHEGYGEDLEIIEGPEKSGWWW